MTCEPILFMCLFALIDHGSHVGALGRKSVFGNLFPWKLLDSFILKKKSYLIKVSIWLFFFFFFFPKLCFRQNHFSNNKCQETNKCLWMILLTLKRLKNLFVMSSFSFNFLTYFFYIQWKLSWKVVPLINWEREAENL